MRARFLTLFGAALAIAALQACTAQSTTGSAGLYCSKEGLCPPGMICSATNVCVADMDATADAETVGASDSAGGKDTAAADTAQQDSAQDSPVADVAQPDAIKADGTVVDTATPDTAKPDSAEDAAAISVTVEDLQKGATSLTCENAAGVVNYAKVTVEPTVLTGTPVMSTNSSGKKSALLYVRPATGPTNASYAGLMVVVQAWPVPFTAGSVIQVTGTVQEFYCMTEVIVDSLDAVVAKGSVAVPNPYAVGIGPLVADPEPMEGALVSISGVVVAQPNLPGTDGKNHGEFTVKSGNAELAVYLPYGSQWLNKDQSTSLLLGDKFASITGHFAYSFGHWVLRPRDDLDLKSGF